MMMMCSGIRTARAKSNRPLLSLFFSVCIILACRLTETTSTSPPSNSQFQGGAIKSDVLHVTRKKKRRRRRRQDELNQELKESSTTGSGISKSTNASATLLPNTSESLLSDSNASLLTNNRTASTQKKRRRRRECPHKVDVLLPLPENEKIRDSRMKCSIEKQPEITNVSIDEKRRSQTQSTPIFSDVLGSSKSIDESSHFQRESIISTATQSDDAEDRTQITVSEDPYPTITTVHTSSRKSEKTESGESNDGQTVTFTREKRKRSIQITTKSRLLGSAEGSKPKHSSHTLKKESKQHGTGKEGECLRRIKREWKDAVKMGIAYDWTKLKTIKKKESTNQNNYVRLGPFGKNLLRWHFSVMGPANSVYQNGIYHGRVLLPKDYPGSPPRVQMLTPSGRFICGEDICLSASNYHPETWTPRWTVLSLVDALRLHMLTTANEIGGIASSDEKRKDYAESSRSWFLPGVADHRRMLTDGVFSIDDDREGDELDMNKTMALDEKPGRERVTKADKQHSEYELADNTILDKPKKTKSRKRSQAGSKVAEKSEPNSTGDIVLGIIHNETVGRSLTKRFFIEMLKLPLRMISILLMILTILETKLRGILDNI